MSRLDPSETFHFFILILCAILLWTMGSIHGRKLQQDLFGKRESIKHRNHEPEITPLYKCRTFGIWVNLWSNAMSYTLWIITFFTIQRYPFQVIWAMVQFFWATGRTAQYAVFAMRLHHTYGHTNYSYSVWVLRAIVMWGACGAFSWVLQAFLVLGPVYDIDVYTVREQNRNSTYDVEVDGSALTSNALAFIYGLMLHVLKTFLNIFAIFAILLFFQCFWCWTCALTDSSLSRTDMFTSRDVQPKN